MTKATSESNPNLKHNPSDRHRDYKEDTEFTDASMPPDNAGMRYKAYYLY